MYAHRERFRDPADHLPLFADAAPLFAPGERFSGASTGYVLLGVVIEQIAGEPWRCGCSGTAAIR